MDNPAAVPPGRIKLIPYFRIIWGAKEVIRGNWYLGLIGLHTKGYPRELWIYLSMRGFLRWSAGTLIVTYFAGAAALAWFYGRNPYNQITYTDLILPTRWSELRTMRGQANIDEGLAKLKAKQYGAAFMLLNQGMARKPDNIPARMVVAQFFTSAGYLSRAMQVYRSGIPHAVNQRRFLEETFRLAEYMEDYEAVLEIADAAEAILLPNELANLRFISDKRILANEKLGRHEANLKLWEAAQPAPSMRLNAAWARALSASGLGNDAITAIRRDPARFGVLREPWELLLELARLESRTDIGRFAVNKLVALEPTRYRFQAIRIAYLCEIAANDEASVAISDYFLSFGYDENAKVSLLQAVEGKISTILLDKIWFETFRTGKLSANLYMSYIQALVGAGDIDRARQLLPLAQQAIAQQKHPDPDWIPGMTLLLNTMSADSPSNRSLLENYAGQRNLPPTAYRAIVRNLLRSGHRETALAIAYLARNRFPKITDLPEIVLPTTTQMAKEETMPRNQSTIDKTQAVQQLQALEIAVAKKRWDEALRHIEVVEKSPIARQASDQLLYFRIAIHGYRSEQTELSWSTRQLLLMQPSLTRLRLLAEQLHADGHEVSAHTVLREVLRRHPEAKWATDLLRTWDKKERPI